MAESRRVADDGEREMKRTNGASRMSNVVVTRPTSTPSTWTVFLFHFVLPMALVAIVSNVSDLKSGTVPIPSHLFHADIGTTFQSTAAPNTKSPATLPKATRLPASDSSTLKQRVQIETTKAISPSLTTKPTSTQSRKLNNNHRHRQNTATDPLHQQMEKNIHALRDQYKQAANTPNEHLAAIQLADLLKYRDSVIHDGGIYQMEAIEVYSKAVSLLENIWRDMMTNGEDTRQTSINDSSHEQVLDRGNDFYRNGLNRELFLDYRSKSIEGLLCAAHCSLGQSYFMSNMFERAVQSYDQCLSYDHSYMDALNFRGQSYIVLGKYKEAATDLYRVLFMDYSRLFVHSVTGLARCLSVDDSLVDGGWDYLVKSLETDIPSQEESLQKAKELGDIATIRHYTNALKHLHHAMFLYHDVKTKNVSEAWHNLSKGNEYKMSILPPFDEAFEIEKASKVKQVFNEGFWPPDMGSDTKTPIFIIGFVRSGSTLLERILDAHPMIVGTGEDSIFNGRLDLIRNQIVKASMTGDFLKTVKELADDVVFDMIERWKIINANSPEQEDAGIAPTRFVDKMLTNYMNVGFIHLLFPNALILHVAREPMDSVFSAFKHDFPAGSLDYTSEFVGLARLYHNYRDVMEHWDNVLPGRVTHIRYEDLVKDLPGLAPKILEKAGVPWDPTVLEFHQKKHAVNTLSNTQVRKGIYSHHLNGWKRYEEFLSPLLEKIGTRADLNLRTSIQLPAS